MIKRLLKSYVNTDGSPVGEANTIVSMLVELTLVLAGW